MNRLANLLKVFETADARRIPLQVNERLICMLPEAVLAFVTNEQSTAARQAKPSLRNHSTASQSGRPESSRGSSRPFQLSRISALSRYRRRVIIFLKFVFICGVSLRRHCCAESRCVTENGLFVTAQSGRGVCVKPSAQSLEKVTDVFFFPGEQGLFFLLFPNARKSAGTNSGQLETEGKQIEIHTDTNDK